MLLKGKCEIVEMLMGLGALQTALFFPEDPGAGVESVQEHLKGVSWEAWAPQRPSTHLECAWERPGAWTFYKGDWVTS